MRRLLRALLTLCLLSAWSASSVGVVLADAFVAGAPSVGAHVESPDAAGQHAAPHADDCALCQVLHVVGDAPAPMPVSAVAQPVAMPSSDVRGGHAARCSDGLAARAPPSATI